MEPEQQMTTFSMTLGRDVEKIRKKSGKIILHDYMNPLFLRMFTQIRESLHLEYGRSIQITNQIVDEKLLSSISYSIQIFMEDQFGKESPVNDRIMTKLSSNLFKDFSLRGSLHTILIVALQFQITVKWEHFDLTPLERKDDGIKLLVFIQRKLIEEKKLLPNKVYFNYVPHHLISTMSNIVERHGGVIVNKAVEATHIVDWDEEVDNLAVELREEFIRTLDLRPEYGGGVALVHWWYHPDSYDEWIPSQDVNTSDPPDTHSETACDKQWNICCRFILDCDIFNEWGNEIDYEIPFGENEDEIGRNMNANVIACNKTHISKGKGRGRRKKIEQQSVETTLKLKKKAPIAEAMLSTADRMMPFVRPPMYDTKRKKITIADVSITNKGGDINVNHFNVGFDQGDISDSLESSDILAFRLRVPVASVTTAEPSSLSTSQKDIHVDSATVTRKRKSKVFDDSRLLLKSPEWYHADGISLLEIKFLGDLFPYFTSKVNAGLTVKNEHGVNIPHQMRDKDASIYIILRKYVLELYSFNPSTYLTATECRRKLCGDVAMMARIHEFLDAFGLINCMIKPEHRHSLSQCRMNGQLDMSNLLECKLVSGLNNGMITVNPTNFDDDDNHNAALWNNDKDSELRKLVLLYGLDWESISRDMGQSYSPKVCLRRFVSLLIDNSSSSSAFAEISQRLQTPGVLTGYVHGDLVHRLGLYAALTFIDAVGRITLPQLEEVVSITLDATNRSSTKSAETCTGNDDSVSNNPIIRQLGLLESRLALVEAVDGMVEVERARLEYDQSDVCRNLSLLYLIRNPK